MISERKCNMAIYLIQTDFNNEAGDITIVKAKDIIEAGNIYKRRRIKDKFVEDEYYGDPEEIIENWNIMYQTSNCAMYQIYTEANDITITITELQKTDYGIIGRYGITDNRVNLFEFVNNEGAIG